MTFNISSDVIQGKEIGCDEDGCSYYTTVEATGSTFEEILDDATIGREDYHGRTLEPWSIGDLRGELYDIVEADLRVKFNAAYQKALIESA